MWRRPSWYAILATVRGTESTIRLFPYLGLVLKYHTGKGVSTKIHSMGRGYFSRFLAM